MGGASTTTTSKSPLKRELSRYTEEAQALLGEKFDALSSQNSRISCRGFLGALEYFAEAIQSIESRPDLVPAIFAGILKGVLRPLQELYASAEAKTVNGLGFSCKGALAPGQGADVLARLNVLDSMGSLCNEGIEFHQHMQPSRIYEAYQELVRTMNIYSTLRFTDELNQEELSRGKSPA